jgi:hypothetical protein
MKIWHDINQIRPLLIRLFPWIGFLVVLIGSSITFEVSGQGAPAGSWEIGTLHQNQSFGQTFVVEYPQLTAIRVRLLPVSPDRSEPVTLRLRQFAAGTPDLVVVSRPIHAIIPTEMTTFSFPPLSLGSGISTITPTLEFLLETPKLPPAEGVTAIAGPDTYPYGVLLVNGAQREALDLAFQPVYLRRWIDVLLPVSHMAAGKPGILGWPPFYALLVYGYGYLLLLGLLKIWRMIRQT